ncbi:uncharacterized protein LOC143894819 isoform X2 [Temnothorax americanus]|uniref:uncharacterized protein LOC143894819 isoform X2 n=1 Tax=Temnothorax americanus TaxID=1964332 RepID=UPI004069472E
MFCIIDLAIESTGATSRQTICQLYNGFYHAIFPVIILEEARFRNYFRMTPTQFKELLILIAPFIMKQRVIREPISAAERLCLTLRFLASGDSMISMSYQYLIGLTTASNIIEETCDAIWNCLQKEVLPSCLNAVNWLNIAGDFKTKWNFNLVLEQSMGNMFFFRYRSKPIC